MIPLLEYVEAANTSMTSIIIIYYTINFLSWPLILQKLAHHNYKYQLLTIILLLCQ